MPIDGLRQLKEATSRLNIDLVALVAETALWANPSVHSWLLAQHPTAAYFPQTRRFRAGSGEVRGIFTATERLDDNTYANHAIRQAIGAPRGQILNYHACHIWPQSCYDSSCHTVVANLVLLPSPLAALSDYYDQVLSALQYRAFELFSWCPPQQPEPHRPERYPHNWRAPEPWSTQVLRSLKARRLEYLEKISVGLSAIDVNQPDGQPDQPHSLFKLRGSLKGTDPDNYRDREPQP